MLYDGEGSLTQKRREAGRKGGSAKVPKGYSHNRDLARESGKVGGKTSRLTEAQVDEIFRYRNQRPRPSMEWIAQKTGVSYGTVQRLCKLWKETGV